MQEEIIKYDTAILAKEKGFDWKTVYFYTEFKKLSSNEYLNHNKPNDYFPQEFSSPTQSLLQKWLREKHNIHVCVDLHTSCPTHWYVRIDDMNTNDYLYHSEDKNIFFNSYEYEKALEHGLINALSYIYPLNK